MYLGPPKITYLSPDKTYTEGKHVSIVCNATNDADAVDQITISWFHKNVTKLYLIVPDNHRVKIFNKPNSVTMQSHSRLLFHSINRIDEGEYICKASNHKLSFTRSSVKVTIKSMYIYVCKCKFVIIM